MEETHTKHRDTIPHLDLSILTVSQPSVIVQKGAASPELRQGVKKMTKSVQEPPAPINQVKLQKTEPIVKN